MASLVTDDPGDRSKRVDALFEQALDLPATARADLLAHAGAGDPELRREVEALLAIAEDTGITGKLARALTSARDSAPRAEAISQYEIIERVGGGGMGVVFKARDRQLERFVALKFLPRSLGDSHELELRFRQEARTIAALDHPNLCTVFEVVEPEPGQLVIVMPYYEGETLKQKIARGPLPVSEALEYARQVADGLAHAHESGVVHRDIKPANVVVTTSGGIRILDFGIAKMTRDNLDLTRTGGVVGTLSYMSPEQSSGDPVDHRTDLWAFGALLYEMLAGRPPFTADSMEALFYAIQWREPVRLAELRPDVPPALDLLVHRLLEKLPAQRPESARAIARALEALREGDPKAASDLGVSPLERARTAFARSAWREAYRGLSEADAAGALVAGPDLEYLAEAAWWLSEGTVCLRARERAYREYAGSDDRRAAARMALALAEDHFHRLAPAAGQGWLRRAERHLENLPEAAEHGWCYRLAFVLALDADGAPEAALTHADRALETARRVGDTDLTVLALQDRGRALVALGRVDEGLALIDEAMTAVTTGELSPRAAGRLYCNMLSTCERLGDFGRAAEWNELSSAWCEPHAESPYPGVCRVQRALILRVRGALSEAEHEARRAADELDGFLADVAGEAFYELGEIRRRRGDAKGAEDMFTEAHARGRDPQPGLALLRLAQDKPAAAQAMIERAIRECRPVMLDRVRLLPALVEIRIAAGDVSEAAAAAAELETIAAAYRTPSHAASAAAALGRVELARGLAVPATLHLRKACRLWSDTRLPYDLAQTRLLLAQAYSVLGNTEEAALEERAARVALARLLSPADLPP